ncbi:hypothetical protein AB1K32_08690 [Metabacillus dongyingensis]
MLRTEEQFEAMRIATRNKIHSAAIKQFANLHGEHKVVNES